MKVSGTPNSGTVTPMSPPLVLPTLKIGLVELRPFADADVGMLIATATDPYIPLVTSVPADGTAAAAKDYI